MSIFEHIKVQSLDPDEEVVQEALGTLTLKKFTITQTLTLTIDVDILVNVTDYNAKSALEQYALQVETIEHIRKPVETKLVEMISSWRALEDRDLTVCKALARALADKTYRTDPIIIAEDCINCLEEK